MIIKKNIIYFFLKDSSFLFAVFLNNVNPVSVLLINIFLSNNWPESTLSVTLCRLTPENVWLSIIGHIFAPEPLYEGKESYEDYRHLMEFFNNACGIIYDDQKKNK